MSLSSKTYGRYRTWEVIPGLLIWTTFFLAFFLSFFAPTVVIVFVIVFDLLWLFRVTYFMIFLLGSWRTYRKTLREDWMKRVRQCSGWQRIHHVIFLPTYKEDREVVRSAFAFLSKTNYPKDRMIIVLAGEERDHEQFQKNAVVDQAEISNAFLYLLLIQGFFFFF